MPDVETLKGLPEPPFTPKRLYKGLPVPYTIPWLEGADKPDFTEVDHDRLRKAVRFGLCGICGNVMEGKRRVWIAGYHAVLPEGFWFVDPPMHEGCARYAARVCPYLLHERVRDEEDDPEGAMHDVAPKAFYIATGVVVHANRYATRPGRLRRIEKIGP